MPAPRAPISQFALGAGVGYQSWLVATLRRSEPPFAAQLAEELLDRKSKKGGPRNWLLGGYDISEELGLGDGILWQIFPDTAEISLCTPTEIRRNLSLSEEAPLEDVLESLFPPEPPARASGLRRFLKPVEKPDFRLYMFAQFWLAPSSSDDENDEEPVI